MDFAGTSAGVTTCVCSTHARLVVAHPSCRCELLRFGSCRQSKPATSAIGRCNNDCGRPVVAGLRPLPAIAAPTNAKLALIDPIRPLTTGRLGDVWLREWS